MKNKHKKITIATSEFRHHITMFILKNGYSFLDLVKITFNSLIKLWVFKIKIPSRECYMTAINVKIGKTGIIN